jgi:hypothetical protein
MEFLHTYLKRQDKVLNYTYSIYHLDRNNKKLLLKAHTLRKSKEFDERSVPEEEMRKSVRRYIVSFH